MQGDLSLPESTTPNFSLAPPPHHAPSDREILFALYFLTVPRGPTFGHQREDTLQGPFLFALSSLEDGLQVLVYILKWKTHVQQLRKASKSPME